jgi:hypothetical protein
MFTLHPPPNFSSRFESGSTRDVLQPHSSYAGHNPRSPQGRLPKLNFLQFDGDNPKLWQSHCENYFDMYAVEQSLWVKVALIHFEGPAARWLQSVDHRI